VDISEDELITAIGRVLSGTGPDVLVPVGDDAAVVRGGAGDLVLTTDALVEGTHFDRAMSRPRDIGYKAIAASISDIAAMAASPRYALCALTLSDDVDAGWAMELFGGMREASDEFACTLIGGNLALGPEVTVAITVTGEVARGAAVRRSGAQPEDVVVVTGTLGGAAAGRRLARRGAPWTEDELDAPPATGSRAISSGSARRAASACGWTRRRFRRTPPPPRAKPSAAAKTTSCSQRCPR